MRDDTRELRCGQCGRTNRVRPDRPGPLCGACKAPLAPSAPAKAPLTVTDGSWPAEVERSTVPVLVDFWAPWCGPCRAVAPAIDQLAREYEGRVKVAKVNVDENPGLAARFGVQSIPMFLVLREGKAIDQIRGAVPKAALASALDRALARQSP